MGHAQGTPMTPMGLLTYMDDELCRIEQTVALSNYDKGALRVHTRLPPTRTYYSSADDEDYRDVHRVDETLDEDQLHGDRACLRQVQDHDLPVSTKLHRQS